MSTPAAVPAAVHAGSDTAVLCAGLPTTNPTLLHGIRFLVGDPTALVVFRDGAGRERRLLLVRDIEMARARRQARVDEVRCPADYAPAGGLSGDREIATAQSLAECLKQHGIRRAIADRSLPLVYADAVRSAGIAIDLDPDLGVLDRRSKDDQEIAWLAEAQSVTEEAMEMACRLVGRARAGSDGGLEVDGAALTSERVRAAIDILLLERGYANPGSIVAGGPQGADCHERGSGPLRTGEPVIIDIFPMNRVTRYSGDCTRCVVHGDVPDLVARMHAAVVAAKAAAIAVARAGVSGEAVHAETGRVLGQHGFRIATPAEVEGTDEPAMVHGTGHGIGLEVHEPPLLDRAGPVLIEGDAVTIEPGLYAPGVGGIRIEDLVIVTAGTPRNLNRLPEGLDWA